jgi:hypothetical protein
MTSFNVSDFHDLSVVIYQVQLVHGTTYFFIQAFCQSGKYYDKIVKSYLELCSYRRELVKAIGKCKCQGSTCGFTSTHLTANELKYMDIVNIFGSMSNQNTKAFAFVKALATTTQCSKGRNNVWSHSCQFLQSLALFFRISKKPLHVYPCVKSEDSNLVNCAKVS